MVVFSDKPASKLRRLAVLLFEEDCKGRIGAVEKRLAFLTSVPPSLRNLTARAIDEELFRGKAGQTVSLVSNDSGGPKRATGAGVGALVLCGLGAESRWRTESLRSAVGLLARRVGRDAGGTVGLVVEGERLAKQLNELGWDVGGHAIAEGWGIGTYRYVAYKTTTPSGTKKSRLQVIGRLTAARSRGIKSGLTRGRVLADGVNFARDLGNAPANEMFPDALARRARAMVREVGGRQSGLSIEVLGEPELTKLKMGALLGVGQGSSRASRMIVLRYRSKTASKKTLALVGKAITFDSGGLSIKPAKGMEEMKFDMCGGGAVLGAMQAIAQLKPRLNVVAVVPSAENMINGSAVRPGDILHSASGKTIEVLNTDAEGRLILADALHYVQRFKPDYTLDFATLTGACVVALGTTVSGIMGNDSKLTRRVFEAGERSGDRVWELPLYQEYIDVMKSQVADLRNSGGRWGGASSAGGFLSNFVGDMKWCHLDIAGTAWTERDAGYFGLGGTGVGVRLTLEFVRDMTA